MKQILESLNISTEIKNELSESFDKAVLVEAVKLAESKEEVYEEYMMDQLTEMKDDLEDTLDAYLEKVVEQFVEDNSFAIDESIKSEKYEAVLEGFNSLMIATGVEIAQIAEAKDEEIDDESGLNKIEEANNMADTLMSENMVLKNKNAELLKTGLIKEVAENMTALQKDKFYRLAKIVEFDASEPLDFINKLDVLSESVSTDKVTESRSINEKVIADKTVHTTNGKYVPKASHLF